MSEDSKPKTDYASNSSKAKRAENAEERPETKQVAKGQIRKKSLGEKFRQNFTGDDADTVGQYLLFDVILPRTKDLIYDLLSQGTERILWGTSTPRSRRSNANNGRTDYRGLSSAPKAERREISHTARANHRFEEIFIESLSEAEETLDTLRDMIDKYESATVSDLYQACGISSNHTDLKFGWFSLDDARVRTVRGGYILDLPNAQPL